MNPPASLLVATDFSVDAGHAARRAAALAAAWGARLELLHVVSRSALDEWLEWAGMGDPNAEATVVAAAREQLQSLVAQLAAETGVAAGGQVSVGRVPAELLAAGARAELLVLGARGTSPLRDMALGSTAERLLRKAGGPVLVVRREPAGPWRRVLVPVDFSAYAPAAVALAMRVAPDAELTLVHAYDTPFEGKMFIAGVPQDRIQAHRADIHHRAYSQMTALLDGFGPGVKRAPPVIVRDDPARLVLETERATQADLIVIGRQGRGMLDEVLLGSVARHVLGDAQCDVLVATAPG